MTDDRQSGVLFGSWLRDTDPTPPDARPSVARVMARLPDVRQRGRWWSLPSFHRQTHTTTVTDTAEYRPSPILATNGHAPTIIGRTHAMFSPAKAITAGALVFVLGGLLLVAQPFDQRTEFAPAAEEDDGPAPLSATYVSGLRTWTGGSGAEDHSYVMHMSDPRVNGVFTEFGGAGYEYPVELTYPAAAAMGRMRLENDEGSWEGVGSGSYHPTMGWHVSGWLAGEGPYEGLTLYLHGVLGMHEYPEMSFEGVIFEGPTPPMLGAVELPAE